MMPTSRTLVSSSAPPDKPLPPQDSSLKVLYTNLTVGEKFLNKFTKLYNGHQWRHFSKSLGGVSVYVTFCSVAGPSTWNSLPDSLRDPELSLDTFKRQLKTYIYTKYWWQNVLSALEIFLSMRYIILHFTLLTYLLTYLTVTLFKKVWFTRKKIHIVSSWIFRETFLFRTRCLVAKRAGAKGNCFALNFGLPEKLIFVRKFLFVNVKHGLKIFCLGGIKSQIKFLNTVISSVM